MAIYFGDFHAVFGDRAGFVETDHRGRTQALHRLGFFGQYPILNELPGAKRHERRKSDRDLLRKYRHSQGQPAEQPEEHIARLPVVDAPHDEEGDDANGRHGLDKRFDLQLQRSARYLNALQRFADFTQLRRRAGSTDLRHRRAGGHQGAVKNTVSARCLIVFHCKGFARQDRFVHGEIIGLHDAGIGGDEVAFFDHDQVAGHDFFAGDFLGLPLPDDF